MARRHHRKHRQHALEHGSIHARLPSGVFRDAAARLLRAEEMAEQVVAAPDIGRLGRNHIIKKAGAAELSEHAAKAIDPAGLLRVLLEAAEDRRRERCRPAVHFAFIYAEFAAFNWYDFRQRATEDEPFSAGGDTSVAVDSNVSARAGQRSAQLRGRHQLA